MADLRASIFIDQLQPQTLAYISTWMRGYLPRLRMAAQIVEIAPGLDVEALTDTVLKSADVRAGLLVVERQFGTLQFHSHSTLVNNLSSKLKCTLMFEAVIDR